MNEVELSQAVGVDGLNEAHIARIAGELSVGARQVRVAAELLGQGSTVPFIARYRKEATGTLDEVAITAIRDRLAQLGELDKRREAICKSMNEQGKLSDELKQNIQAADSLAVLEDIYLPYKPKRRTRAMIAREKGLEPLAAMIFAQGAIDPPAEAGKFVSAEKGVESPEDALAGARDIIAEWINEDAPVRARLRELFATHGAIRAKVIVGKESEAIKFKDYFDWQEPVATAPSHRILAVRRGEKEGFLSHRVLPEEQEAMNILEGMFVKSGNAASQQVKLAVQDCYKRLLSLSLETEIRIAAKDRADAEAIRVFAENMRELLLSPALGQKNVLALDPGFRTGCKVVCLDRQGKLLYNDVIYPHEPQRQTAQSAAMIEALCSKFQIEAISIGNGTAGRETEAFCRGLKLPGDPTIVMVNESGASVYSASDVAREEFPDHDLTVRGSVSIGRRLMDPLAELVKIDPKSIGVGQYQHDVDQLALKKGLDDVVISCVNGVGVEVNTASKQLLSYVSGLGPQLASNIVSHRNENGPFRSRAQLRNVPRLGPKAFEQAAGFLRIREGENPLDASAVHPESYPIVDAMAKDLGCSVADLVRDAELRRKIDLKKYVTDTVGLPTLTDILAELAKPGRDPRKQFEAFNFAEGVSKIGDLQPGMKLPGVVTNVAAFGAFVDIGVHQDGLVHISQLSDQYVKNASDVVKVQQRVMVTVMEVDFQRQRIALSMKTNPEAGTPRSPGSGDSKGPRTPRGPQQARPQAKPKAPAHDPNNPFVDFFKNWKPKA